MQPENRNMMVKPLHKLLTQNFTTDHIILTILSISSIEPNHHQNVGFLYSVPGKSEQSIFLVLTFSRQAANF